MIVVDNWCALKHLNINYNHSSLREFKTESTVLGKYRYYRFQSLISHHIFTKLYSYTIIAFTDPFRPNIK